MREGALLLGSQLLGISLQLRECPHPLVLESGLDLLVYGHGGEARVRRFENGPLCLEVG